MNISFVGADKNFIQNAIQSGLYHDEVELVRDAVRRMREEKEHIQRFQNAIAKGQEAIEQGKTVKLTPALLNEIMVEAIRKHENGEPYNSYDAIPKQ